MIFDHSGVSKVSARKLQDGIGNRAIEGRERARI
jgi:hypothetical protein